MTVKGGSGDGGEVRMGGGSEDEEGGSEGEAEGVTVCLLLRAP